MSAVVDWLSDALGGARSDIEEAAHEAADAYTGVDTPTDAEISSESSAAAEDRRRLAAAAAARAHARERATNGLLYGILAVAGFGAGAAILWAVMHRKRRA